MRFQSKTRLKVCTFGRCLLLAGKAGALLLSPMVGRTYAEQWAEIWAQCPRYAQQRCSVTPKKGMIEDSHLKSYQILFLMFLQMVYPQIYSQARIIDHPAGYSFLSVV